MMWGRISKPIFPFLLSFKTTSNSTSLFLCESVPLQWTKVSSTSNRKVFLHPYLNGGKTITLSYSKGTGLIY